MRKQKQKSALETRIDFLDSHVRKQNELIESLLVALRAHAAGMQSVQQETREERTKQKARWDCVKILLEDVIERLDKRPTPAREIVALVDAARAVAK